MIHSHCTSSSQPLAWKADGNMAERMKEAEDRGRAVKYLSGMKKVSHNTGVTCPQWICEMSS